VGSSKALPLRRLFGSIARPVAAGRLMSARSSKTGRLSPLCYAVPAAKRAISLAIVHFGHALADVHIALQHIYLRTVQEQMTEKRTT
jgi:hypothetical protein